MASSSKDTTYKRKTANESEKEPAAGKKKSRLSKTMSKKNSTELLEALVLQFNASNTIKLVSRNEWCSVTVSTIAIHVRLLTPPAYSAWKRYITNVESMS